MGNSYTPASGAKGLYRLVDATDGKFEFFSPGREPSERNLAGSLEMHLIEAARHKGEMALLREELPSGETELSFNKNMVAPVAKIPYPMLEVMVAIHKNENMLPCSTAALFLTWMWSRSF